MSKPNQPFLMNKGREKDMFSALYRLRGANSNQFLGPLLRKKSSFSFLLTLQLKWIGLYGL